MWILNFLSTARGLYAVKWVAKRMFTALFQILIIQLSGSVAHLAETLHNFEDVATSILLEFAFFLSRKKSINVLVMAKAEQRQSRSSLRSNNCLLLFLSTFIVIGWEIYLQIL
ncbi:MAG TPA: hypothetical protein VN278_05660 [Methanosarcina sp.]|nr:hypothetical protein [Methanosarcina sp.]